MNQSPDDLSEIVFAHGQQFIDKHGPFSILNKIDRDLHRRITGNASLFMTAKALSYPNDEVILHARALYMSINDAFSAVSYDADMRAEHKSRFFINVAALRGFSDHPGNPPHRAAGNWWDWYRKYLKSESWSNKRKLVMARCDQTCEGCGTEPATQVHHKTYDHVGYEFLFELLGLCKGCHERFHKK